MECISPDRGEILVESKDWRPMVVKLACEEGIFKLPVLDPLCSLQSISRGALDPCSTFPVPTISLSEGIAYLER